MASPKTLKLPDSMDISAVSEFHTTLCNDIAEGDEVTFLATNVERADTAFIQLLAVFCSSAPSRNISIQWQAPSQVLLESVKQLGLASELKLA
ncbi:STAS domain-containing protein [Kaarinaea lacus]